MRPPGYIRLDKPGILPYLAAVKKRSFTFKSEIWMSRKTKMPDESIPESPQNLERRLATILCADIAGYSKMMAESEERTVRVFRGHREIFESLVKLHRGRIFNTAGDALLAEFNSAVEAVRCATEIQAALRTRNEHLAPEERMQFRVGINLGDVIVQGGDLLGDGVNIAARIQTATAPGGICISGSVYDQIQNKLSLDFKLLGEQTYKNIAKPVRTYTIQEGGSITTPTRRMGWRMSAAIAAAVLLIAGAAYWGYQQSDRHRSEGLLENVEPAEQPAAQKQAAEHVLPAVEDTRREAQAKEEKLAAEDALRRAQQERNLLEQERKRLDTEKQAAEQARRAVEDARREAQAKAEKMAAEDALRRAQQERNLLEQERKRLDTEKQATEQARRAVEDARREAQAKAEKLAAQKQTAEPARRLVEETRPEAQAKAEKSAVSYDGTYNGRLCNQLMNREPLCWPVALKVSNGIAEGSWMGRLKKTARVNGTISADGSVRLNLSGWTPSGAPTEGALQGSLSYDRITAAGAWKTGGRVTGNWKRAP